jgi:hypothetical protein
MSNISRTETNRDTHAKRYGNPHRAFQYSGKSTGLATFDFRPHRLNFLGAPSQNARSGKIAGNLIEYPKSINNYMKDPRGDSGATLRDEAPAGFFKNMIDPYSLIKDVANFLTPSDKIDGKLGDYNNKPVAYAHDLSYIGSDGIMGKRDHPMLYYHDIVEQRPEHTNPAKTREGLQRYADNLLKTRHVGPEMRHSVYHFIDQITATDSDLLKKSTVMEMEAHVNKQIQTFRPGKNSITRKIYYNTL